MWKKYKDHLGDNSINKYKIHQYRLYIYNEVIYSQASEDYVIRMIKV